MDSYEENEQVILQRNAMLCQSEGMQARIGWYNKMSRKSQRCGIQIIYLVYTYTWNVLYFKQTQLHVPFENMCDPYVGAVCWNIILQPANLNIHRVYRSYTSSVCGAS